MSVAANSQVLYTYGSFNGSSTVQVGSINLSTGALTPLVTTDAIGLVFEDAAIDPVSHRLFFVGISPSNTNALYTVNLTAGTFSKLPGLPGSFGQLEFDAGSGTLYTYGSFNGSSPVQVGSINLSTGALTPLVTTDAIGLVFEDAAIDPVSHRLFFVGTSPSNTNALYTVNLTAGTFSKLPGLSGSFGQLEFDDGVASVPTPVPAPSTLGLVLCGLSILVLARRRLATGRYRQRPSSS